MTAITLIQDGLVFDPETHAYLYRGEELTSVTTMLTRAGLIDTEWYRPEHAERGRQVHEAVAELGAGTLIPEALCGQIRGYVAAYERFKSETRFDCYLSETPLCSTTHRYAGTFDLLGWLGDFPGLTLLDIKTGAYFPWHVLQLDLYARLISENSDALGLDRPVDQRLVLQLRQDGTYRLKFPTMEENRITQLTNSLLTLHHFREGRMK